MRFLLNPKNLNRNSLIGEKKTIPNVHLVKVDVVHEIKDEKTKSP